MPTYKITDPTSGKVLRLTGDSPPTESELNEIFQTVSQSQPEPQKQPGYGERIGAAFTQPLMESGAENLQIMKEAQATSRLPTNTIKGDPLGRGAFNAIQMVGLGAAGLGRGVFGAAAEVAKPAAMFLYNDLRTEVKQGIRTLADLAQPAMAKAGQVVSDVKSKMTPEQLRLAKVAEGYSYLPLGGLARGMFGAGEKAAAQAGKKTIADLGAIAPAKTVSGLTIPEIRKSKSIIFTDVNNPVEAAAGKIEVAKSPSILPDLSKGEYNYLAQPRAEGTKDFSEYIKQMELKDKAGPDPKIKTPYQMASQNATRAFESVDNMRRDAGKELSAAIESAAGVNVVTDNLKTKFLELVEERIGGVAGGDLSASAQEASEATMIGNFLMNLPRELSIKDAQRLKQNLRDGVTYDANGKYRADTSRLQGIIKDISNDIDQQLDASVAGYKQANEKYSQAIRVENLLSRALREKVNGQNNISKMGTSIMKRGVESLANSGIDEIFQMVKELTGGKYDLAQDAFYASVAMRLSSDPRYREQAARFGAILKAISPTIEGQAAGAATQIMGNMRRGGASQRLIDWYNKAQGKAPSPTRRAEQATDVRGEKIPGAGMLKNQRGAIGENPHGFNTKNSVKIIKNLIHSDKKTKDGNVYGIRVHSYPIKEGQVLKPSRTWDFENDMPSKALLKGTSTLGLGEDPDVSDIINQLRRAGQGGKNRRKQLGFGGYEGEYIALVRGEQAWGGDDVGESIIKNPVVLKVFKRDLESGSGYGQIRGSGAVPMMATIGGLGAAGAAGYAATRKKKK
jgi:hypothetical protein